MLGNKVSEDDVILNQKPNPNILVIIWFYLYLAKKKAAEGEKGTDYLAHSCDGRLRQHCSEGWFPYPLSSVLPARVASLEARLTTCVKWWSLKELKE